MNISLHRLTDCLSADYQFAETLLTTSFPPEEYRDLSEWKTYTKTHAQFHNQVVKAQHEGERMPIGLVGYWDFDWFIYIEHLATSPQARNAGYGSQILKILQQLNRPLILEVEEPIDEMTRRRIGFYQRNGFTLWQKPYLQPPYRAGGKQLPLKLMAWGKISEAEDFEMIKQTLYSEVYNVK